MSSNNTQSTKPNWVSPTLFPFQSRFFQSSEGKIHYIDEGSGPPLVFVHGNPSWSFEYRYLVSSLKSDFRCIALDHLGFGLSDRSTNILDYHPREHARRFSALMKELRLNDITLVFSDWGGPISLDFARSNPEKVSRLIVMNSWSWPVNEDPHFLKFSSMMSSWIGQFLIKRFNFFVNQVMPRAAGRRGVFTKEVMNHYRKAQSDPIARCAGSVLPGYIVDATDWLDEIWTQRASFLDKPLLILWGLKDIAFRTNELQVWRETFSHATTREFSDCGHFLAEESPEAVTLEIRNFLNFV